MLLFVFFDTNISIYLQGSGCVLWLGACAKRWEVGRSSRQNRGAIVSARHRTVSAGALGLSLGHLGRHCPVACVTVAFVLERDMEVGSEGILVTGAGARVGWRVLRGGRFHVQVVLRGSARAGSAHSLTQPVRRGWGSRADMLGRGQGCSVGKLILTRHFLVFRCLAAVPHLEGTRHSLVVLTPLKFWGICTLFQDFTRSPGCCCSLPP